MTLTPKIALRPRIMLTEAKTFLRYLDVLDELRSREALEAVFSEDEMNSIEIFRQVLAKTIASAEANEIIKRLRSS